MKLFISYSRDDKAWVYELWRALRDRAYHDAWLDQRVIPAQDWWESILQNIETCECFLYVMSSKSVESIYCQAELGHAIALNKPILPLLLKPCDYPAALKQRRIHYHTITDGSSLGDVLFTVATALGEIRLELMQGKWLSQSAERPAEPKADQKPEQVSEVFMLAEEAASENNFSLADKLFQQVMDADPQGWGLAAAERLAEIRFERQRAAEYVSIVQMVNNPTLIRGARAAARIFIGKYPDYDPDQIFPGLLNQAVTPPPVEVQQVPVTPPSMPTEADSYTPEDDTNAEADKLFDVSLPVEEPPATVTPPLMPVETENYTPEDDLNIDDESFDPPSPFAEEPPAMIVEQPPIPKPAPGSPALPKSDQPALDFVRTAPSSQRPNWATIVVILAIVGLLVVIVQSSTFFQQSTNVATPLPGVFGIYSDYNSPDNHFDPSSGQMGDLGDIQMNLAWTDNPHSGTTSIRIEYTHKGQGLQGTYGCPGSQPPCKWAGVYWQNPAGNFGKECVGGYDLHGFQKVTFWARSDDPVKIIFQVSGSGWNASLPCSDSQYEPKRVTITLSKEWKRYEIPLSNVNLSYVIGGFAWVSTWADNKGYDPVVFYLDDIQYER